MNRVAAIAVAVAAAFTLLAGAGCGSACQSLGERICNCQPAGAQRDACNQSVRTQVGSGAQKPDDVGQAYCQVLLDDFCNAPAGQTFCDWVLSPEGKVACGAACPTDTPAEHAQWCAMPVGFCGKTDQTGC